MTYSFIRLAASALTSFALLAGADFTYEQKTEITGGSMKRMMDMAARFSRQAAGPQTTTHRYSGDKMSVQSANSITIYDLAADTVTQIDPGKKEYSVIGFTEMMELTKGLMSKFSQGQDQGVEVNWKASVDLTGKTKPVSGVDTKQAILKVEMEAQDPSKVKSGVSGMDMDMWIGAMPGYQIVRDFQRKMAEKMSIGAGVNPMMMSQMGSGGMRAMMEAGKKLAELDGIPLETTMRMKGMMGIPGMSQQRPPEASGQQQSQQQSNEAAQLPSSADVKDAAKEKAAEAAAENTASRVTRGRLGGLGGNMGGMLGGRLGRGKKKEEAQPAPQAQAEPAPAAPPAAPAPAPAPAPSDQLAMESVTTVTSFNSNPVDPSAFAVPAGYKQVDHPLKKMK